jgi:hypothetical protein
MKTEKNRGMIALSVMTIIVLLKPVAINSAAFSCVSIITTALIVIPAGQMNIN